MTGSDQRRAAAAEAHREHQALAEPVGEQTPRQEREQGPDPEAVEHDANAEQAQVVLVTQRRGEDGETDEDRRERGLCGRPGREHEPAVAALGYRPNGLNGFGLVETITLFVSRYASSVSSPSSRPKPDCL